jgi:hypothetical protein
MYPEQYNRLIINGNEFPAAAILRLFNLGNLIENLLKKETDIFNDSAGRGRRESGPSAQHRIRSSRSR